MMRFAKSVVAVVVTGVLVLGAAREGCADEDLRQMIRDEVAAYMATPAVAPTPAPAAKGDDGNVFKVYWKDGLRLDTKDGSVKLKIGGRIHLDANFFGDSDLEKNAGVDLHDGVEFRRVRLYNSGQIGKHVGYKAQFEFAGGDVEFKDIYIELNHLRDCFGCGFPNVRVGHMFEPFALEGSHSSKYYTFMEVATSTEALTLGRNTGVMLYDNLMGDRLNYGVGYFLGDTPGQEDKEGDGFWVDDGYGITGSVSYAPWWDCDCECNRWFVGVSASYRDELDEIRFRARPGLHVTNERLVDTGVIPRSDSYTSWSAFTALMVGRWSFQAEYFNVDVDAPAVGDPTFTGYYAFVSYWLTGECRTFKHAQPDRTAICCDFLDDDCCCKGGLELAARYDHLDLTDAAIVGGDQSIITVGVNWYWNANMRVMLNVLFGDVNDGKGTINESWTAVGLSFRIDW